MVINKLIQPFAEKNKSSINSAETFQNAIIRERCLSDRNNHGFSLVRFNIISHNDIDCFSLEQLIEILSNRKRDVDIIGRQSNKNEMSVLLPDTDNDGARNFTRRIVKEFENVASCIDYKISTYPRDNWNELHSNAPISKNSYTTITDDAYSTVITENGIPVWKRTLDIFGAITGIILLLPLFALVALLIKIVSPGPALFKQKRVGRFGKTFDFYKFRTMSLHNDDSIHESYLKELIHTDDNNDKPMMKIKNDSRIIPFGNFLRKSCIDELPQLLNVLFGKMSLVGPRPCIPYEAEEYLRWHARRFDVIPGMTGLWQVSGKNKTTFKEMIRFDIKYAANSSLWLDLFIILKTPFAIFSQIIDKQDTTQKNKMEKTSKPAIKGRLAAEIF